jgi:phage baseplate assembly protein gpV
LGTPEALAFGYNEHFAAVTLGEQVERTLPNANHDMHGVVLSSVFSALFREVQDAWTST